jgi:hypothetical protein
MFSFITKPLREFEELEARRTVLNKKEEQPVRLFKRRSSL